MGPLFQWKDGRYLTRDKFVVKVRAALAAASLDPSKYAGYSFRNRAAMTAARCGIQDALIKTLGRWVSTAYVRYIQMSSEFVCSVACTLVQSEGST